MCGECSVFLVFCVFKQKTAYEMRISEWSSDVCSSDLPEDVGRVAGAGGRLVVSPNAEPAVVEACKAQGLIAVPGFATPTEALRLARAGADALKLFPAEGNPPEVVKAMRAVFPPGLPVLAVGSITPEKINAYWQAGVRGFGLGGSLYRPGDGPAEVAPRVPPFRDAIAMARAEAELGERA